MPYDALLARAQEHARRFLAALPARPVHARAPDPATPDAAVLSRDPVPPLTVLDSLAQLIEQGSVATPGPRYFGFVTGGSYPAPGCARRPGFRLGQKPGGRALSPGTAGVVGRTGA